MSFALPGLAGEFGYSKTSLGLIGTSFFMMYALGQFINGLLGDKLGARKLVFTGAIISIMLNIAFGFSIGLYAMIFLWGMNGYFQSMGWAPQVKAAASWYTAKQRGKWMGFLGSSYQIGNAYTWILVSFLAANYGWRTIFWIPAAIFFVFAIHHVIMLRNAPEDIGLPSIAQLKKIEDGQAVELAVRDDNLQPGSKHTEVSGSRHTGVFENIKFCVTNFEICGAAMALFCLNIVRYGFFFWAPVFLIETQGAAITTAGLKVAVLPLAGSIGAITAGWASGRFFNNRRAPVVCVLLVGLALFSYLFYTAPPGAWQWGLVCLAIVGFCTYGPHILLVGHFPSDVAGRKVASSAAGFIDGCGYIGASMTGFFTGFLVEHFGWSAGFYYWIAAALTAAGIMLFMWRIPVVDEKE
jgi:sugar phosphate permease